MIDLALHDQTRRALERFVNEPSHSLMLLGPTGSGKFSLAEAIVAQVIGDIHKGAVLTLTAPGKSISIEAIREAQQFVRLKTVGEQTFRRAIIVEDAHKLTHEAQNAFLKLLEEPPADTIIILTVANREDLLPTILSRTRVIHVKPIPQAVLMEHFKAHDTPSVTKAYHISSGHPGLMRRLLDNEHDDELLKSIDDAKQFLQLKPFERLVFVDTLTKAKSDLQQFLWALQTVSQAALHQAAHNGRETDVKRWSGILEAIIAAKDSLVANPLPKLLLTNLCLQLS